MTSAAAKHQILDEVRTKIRAPIERRLDEILDSFEDDNEALTAFQLARADLDRLVTKLEHEELLDLARQLDAHSADLKAGIVEMGDGHAFVRDHRSGDRPEISAGRFGRRNRRRRGADIACAGR